MLAVSLAASVLDSRFRIVSDEYVISSGNLPESFDGFRIVQISDLHGRVFGKDNAGLFEAVRSQMPDIIALTGDFIDDVADIPLVREVAAALTDIAPVYFISGNHDWASGAIEELARALESAGVKYLRNEYLELTRDGESIVLCGVEDPNGYVDMKKPTEIVRELREKYPDSFTLLLAHRNNWLDVYPTLDVDAVLCGHAHGGIVRLPFVGGVVGTDHKLFPEYTSGLYEGRRYSMVVSRGLGDSVPLSRVFNNAHLPVIALKAAN